MKIKHKKLKIKKVFIFATLALCIGIFVFWKFSQPAVASWFNDNWAYRQAVTVTVTSSASDLTNFPINITVNTSALISSKLQTDCDDLRFTNATGDLLPYYINSGCNTTSTKIWIMTDLIPKNSTTFTIYMYYGNPSATAGSTTNYGLNLYQGLIGYWNMNESSWTGDCSTATVKDLSGSGQNGKACPNGSAPTITSSGKYGNGGSFDGTNDNVQTTSNLNVNFANITVSTWFNSLDVTTTRRILEHAWDAGGVFGFHQQTGTAHAVLRNANGDQMGDIDYGTVSTGTWYNLVQTYDGHTWIGYLNGVYVDSIIDSTGLLQYSGVLYLGSINYPYRGTLDETRVYNRALSSTEVAQLYNDSTSPILTSTQGIVVPSTAFAAEEKTPGPIAYWAFDEGYGSTAYDSTANAANGTLPSGGPGVDPTLSGTTSPAATTGSTSVSIGTGADGACTVSSATNINTASCAGRGTADAVNFSSTANTAASATAIVLTATSTGLAVGDEVLIINLKGTSGANADVGEFETKTISSITTTTNADDTLNFATGLTNGYDGTTQKIMVQRVPNYTNVTVNNGQTMTADAWNGTKNGVLFFRASGTVTVTGTISMAGKGYAGGAAATATDVGGNGGETYNGTGGLGGNLGQNGASGQGGGGGAAGDATRTGGTGTTGGAGGGSGANINAGGGGGGGYGAIGSGGTSRLGTHNGSNGSGTSGGNGGNSVLNDSGGGGGGGTSGIANLTSLFFGSGGGGGGAYSIYDGSAGGAGGGIINIAGSTITVTGAINGSGAAGTAVAYTGAGPGGGGAGGSVRISGTTLTLGTTKVTATAGAGGAAGETSDCTGGYDKDNNCLGWTYYYSSGIGGAGGVGRIAIDNFASAASDASPTWITSDQCVSGKCLSFNGSNNSVTVANVITGVQTVSMWVKPISVTSGALIDLDGGTHKITVTNGTLSATGFASPTIYVNGKVSSTLVANTWQYVTVTTGTGFNSSSSLTIGRSVSTYLNGFIDEVKIYSYARNAAQVKTDFAARGSVKGVSAQMGGADQAYLSNGLVGYWKMDESSGNAVDSSGNGLTLTNNSTAVYGTGKFGNGITGDGTADYLNTATAINGIKTVSFWAYTPDTTNYFINLINSSAYITSTTGTISATGFTSPSIYVNGVLNGTITANTWTHIVITTNTGINANAFAIGLTNDGSNHFLTNTSKIDEARVYNRALSPKEAADLFNFAPGPIGYWKMDEGSGTTINDISGNTYTGTWQGSTATHWMNGKFGKATNYNGSSTSTGTGDYISTTLTMPTVGSIAFWYKATLSAAESRIFGAESASTGVHGVGLSTNLSGNLYAIFRNNSTSGDIDSGSAASTTAFEHIGMTWGADGTKLYRNGVLVGSSTAITSITTGSLTLNLGACGSGTCYRYNGLLDDVKVYNYVRTQKQIVSDMNADHPSVGSPIGSSVAYWDFDEGNSTIAHDLIPNANNLTLSTASWTDSGKFGKAWNGLGTNWLSIADDADFDVSATDDYTISLWFKSDSANNPGATEYLVDKGPIKASSAGYAIYANTDGTVCFAIDDDTTWDPDVVSCSPTDIYDGTWHHLVAVRDHTNTDKTILYVDAVLKDSDSDTTTATLANAQILYIGDSNGVDGGDEFNGDLDEIKVYRFTLTSSEVKTDYNRGQSIQLGAAGNNSTYQPQANNQEYCVPGDATACLPPIGRWDFEEGKNDTCSGGFNDICDVSGNGKDGIRLTNANWASGKYGKGFYFAGIASNNSITFGDNFDITASDNMTWEVWFKSDGQNRSQRRGIGGKKAGETSSSAGYWSSIWTDGILQTVISNGTTQITLTSANAVDDSKWHHIAVLINRTTGNSQLYLDGKLEDTDTTPTTPSADLSNSINYCYGASCQNSAVFPFKGTIDQGIFFNYIRTPAQIAYDFNKGKPVAYWDFDECQGTQVYDLSGNSNTGTITVTSTLGTCITASTFWGGSGGTGAGKRNYAPTFNGTGDFITTAAFSPLAQAAQTTTSLSWGGWFYPTTSAASKTLLEKATEFQLTTDANSMPICGVYYTGAFHDSAAPTTALTLSAWNHIICTYDGTNINTYLNGKLMKQSAETTAVTAASSIFYIAETSGGTNRYSGQIDDVKIWNYALTATQVKNEYNGGALNYAPTTGSP